MMKIIYNTYVPYKFKHFAGYSNPYLDWYSKERNKLGLESIEFTDEYIEEGYTRDEVLIDLASKMNLDDSECILFGFEIVEIPDYTPYKIIQDTLLIGEDAVMLDEYLNKQECDKSLKKIIKQLKNLRNMLENSHNLKELSYFKELLSSTHIERDVTRKAIEIMKLVDDIERLIP